MKRWSKAGKLERMREALAWAMLAGFVFMLGCSSAPPQKNQTQNLIEEELRRAAAQRQPAAVPAPVSEALLMPQLEAQRAREAQAARDAEPRFNLAINNAPAAQVFAALGAGSRYSIVVPPDLSGNLTLNLKNVTLPEALEVIRDAYGYDYRINGERVIVQPQTLQSRIFKINYLAGTRAGQSDTRVISGSIQNSTTPTSGTTSSGGGTTSATGAVVQTQNKSDFWSELTLALKTIVGEGDGRSVVVSPQSGVVIVRALPPVLREVENFIRLSQLSVERQVMLEAKIVQVELTDAYQNGINWTALLAGSKRVGVGLNNNQVLIPSNAFPNTGGGQIADVYNTQASTWQPNILGNVLSTPGVSSLGGQIPISPLAGALGLTFGSGNFNAVLSFLETQGTVHVMSSPRIATINNQKAVLKVGSDDYFVTNVSTTTSTSATGNVVTPTINLQAFFSGISLDVMPQIDDDGENVMLHIRPSVSVVTERSKQINLGTAGVFTLPLASSRSNETDSIVRVRDGNIVAIGGLMEQAQTNDNAKVPGLGDVPVVGELFSQGRKALQKRELVVLLKATIIRSDKEWEQDMANTAGRISGLQPEPQGPKLLR